MSVVDGIGIQKELDKAFKENENRYGLTVSMFSLERLWSPFVFTTNTRKWDVQSKVRQCMDRMWDRIFAGKSIEGNKADFIGLLDSITDGYAEEEVNDIRYNYCFDNYLINALYSNIGYFFDVPGSEGYKVRISASMAVLELLSDYIIDNSDIKSVESFQNNINGENLLLSERERINHDLLFMQKNGGDWKRIKELKDYYTSLEILPIKTLKLKEI